MVDMGKKKNYEFTNVKCISDDWHFNCQATQFILRFAVWFYCSWLSGKHYAKSLYIKSVGTSMLKFRGSSKNLKFLFLLSREGQEMPGPQQAASCVLDPGN